MECWPIGWPCQWIDFTRYYVWMLFEDAFIYHPLRYPEGQYHRAAQPDHAIQPFPIIEDVWLDTPDGWKLHAWYCTPALRDGDGHALVETNKVVLYLHGNAGNVASRYHQLHLLMFLGCNILILDYRGYGRSEGRPTEAGLYIDALCAWQYLTQQRGFAPREVTMMGNSLGGAVAIELAARQEIDLGSLILQSTFTNVGDMARRIMPIIPRRWLRHQFDSLAKIPAIACPKLFIHSPDDDVVPFEQGQRLYDAAINPKRFFDVPGADHNDTTLLGGKRLLRAMHETIHSA